MNEIDALLLGIIQGLTEFLPVSSSGHIELGKEILGSKLINGQNLLFTIILHFATALSTIIVFRKDIIELITKSFSSGINDQKRFLFFIALSIIPAVVIGLFFEKQLEILFSGNIFLVGFMLIITGFLLFSTTIFKNNTKRLTSKTSILIGISQAIAMLPGISRSGATISVSLLLGINKSVRVGKRVLQGRTIGYVGSSGRSTGPHLHYEVIVNGKKINSQTLKLPSGKIFKGNERKIFETKKIKLDVLKSEKIIGIN